MPTLRDASSAQGVVREGETTLPRAMSRPLSRGERVVDGWVNAIGLAAAVVGFAILIGAAAPESSFGLKLSLVVYGSALVVMLGCSALYNARCESPRRDLFRRLDHAAIFVMIAATYTPFLAVKIGGLWGMGLLVYVWAGAGAGVAMKLLWLGRFERFSVVLYLFLGWTIVVAIDPLFSSVSLPAIMLLVIGGVLYSVGVVFYLWEQLAYQQAIWHGFVIAAAGCHYAAVMGEIALADGST
jgi:hemolysin III